MTVRKIRELNTFAIPGLDSLLSPTGAVAVCAAAATVPALAAGDAAVDRSFVRNKVRCTLLENAAIHSWTG